MLQGKKFDYVNTVFALLFFFKKLHSQGRYLGSAWGAFPSDFSKIVCNVLNYEEEKILNTDFDNVSSNYLDWEIKKKNLFKLFKLNSLQSLQQIYRTISLLSQIIILIMQTLKWIFNSTRYKYIILKYARKMDWCLFLTGLEHPLLP